MTLDYKNIIIYFIYYQTNIFYILTEDFGKKYMKINDSFHSDKKKLILYIANIVNADGR